jgi:hypothetical protein
MVINLVDLKAHMHGCSFLDRLFLRSRILQSITMLLGLKPSHACDVISAVTELMVDVAGVEAKPCV